MMRHYEFQRKYWESTRLLREELARLEKSHREEVAIRQKKCTHLGDDGQPDFGREYLMCDEWGHRCEICGKVFDEVEYKQFLRYGKR